MPGTRDKFVILVGHGGVPTDCPPALVSEFKRLEAAARGRSTPELLAADRKLREWPRTEKTDPYKTGLEAVARALGAVLPGHEVALAYNEFCAPSLEDAFASCVARGARAITVISTMYTRGGIHSEAEIPEILARLRAEHPAVDVRYAWPFDLSAIAAMLAGEIKRAELAAKALLLSVLLLATPAGAALFGKAKKAKAPVVPATAPAPKPEDPLRALSAEEIATAVSTVREAGVFGSSAAFALVALREPAKGELPAARAAQLVVVDDERRETSEAVVDLKARKLETWRLLMNLAPARAPVSTPEPVDVSTAGLSAPSSEVRLDGELASWDRWKLRASVHPREGLVISDVSFDGRPVLARASASEVAALSDDGGRLEFKLVEADLGFGRRARALRPRVDAPADAALIDAAFADDAGRPYVVPRAVALFPRRGLAGSRELVVRFATRADDREYAQVWTFAQDGSLQARVEVSGSTRAVEQHYFCYRVDLDVDGSTGSVLELGVAPAPGRPLTPGALALRKTLAARRDASPVFARRWAVASADGERGYALIPGEGTPMPGVDPRRAAFLGKSFWATPYHPEQQYAAGEYPSSGRLQGLERWTRDDAPLDGRDVVVWHVFGTATLPGGGSGAASFRLQPVQNLLTPAL